MFAMMQTLMAIEQRFVDELVGLYDAEESRQLCYLLMEAQMGWSKTDYLLHKRQSLNDEDRLWLQNALQQLRTATPIQYFLGHTWFMGMKLSVNDSVLIPRPETEELIDLIVKQQQINSNPSLRMIDIGTGSGCIAIALKKAFPDAFCQAMDISADALAVARKNAQIQRADIRFIQADILEWDVVFPASQPFDIVVSNPPYITTAERQEMHRNVLAHEPPLALFVEDHAPLLFYEHIAAFAQQHLLSGGSLYVEINSRYGQQVCELLQKKGFVGVQLHRDIHGADRMVHAKKDRTFHENSSSSPYLQTEQ